MVRTTKTIQRAGADAFTAIAHPVRRSILDLLVSGEQPVNHIAAMFDLSRPAISQHLRILLDAGLVEQRRAGRQNLYHLLPEHLLEVQYWLGKYEQFWQERLGALGDYLREAYPQARAGPDETRAGEDV